MAAKSKKDKEEKIVSSISCGKSMRKVFDLLTGEQMEATTHSTGWSKAMIRFDIDTSRDFVVVSSENVSGNAVGGSEGSVSREAAGRSALETLGDSNGMSEGVRSDISTSGYVIEAPAVASFRRRLSSAITKR